MGQRHGDLLVLFVSDLVVVIEQSSADNLVVHAHGVRIVAALAKVNGRPSTTIETNSPFASQSVAELMPQLP